MHWIHRGLPSFIGPVPQLLWIRGYLIVIIKINNKLQDMSKKVNLFTEIMYQDFLGEFLTPIA